MTFDKKQCVRAAIKAAKAALASHSITHPIPGATVKAAEEWVANPNEDTRTVAKAAAIDAQDMGQEEVMPYCFAIHAASDAAWAAAAENDRGVWVAMDGALKNAADALHPGNQPGPYYKKS